MMDFTKPLPTPTPLTAPFWHALERNEVHLQRCSDCRSFVHYPRSRCPHCASASLAFEQVAGTGTLYTFSIARVPTVPHFADEVPQLLAVVDLDGTNARVTSTLVGVDPADIRVGMPLHPVFDHQPGVTLLRFAP